MQNTFKRSIVGIVVASMFSSVVAAPLHSATQSNVPAGGDGKSFVEGQLTNALTGSAESILSKVGTARVELSGISGDLHGSIDLLVPLLDNKDDLTFTQFGLRHNNMYTGEYRTTLNLGLGHRKFIGNHMLGANVFLDQDVTNKHTRLGLGAEYGADNVQLNANIYKGLSGWKDASNLDGYETRAADGVDIKFKGYLPQHPQLGMTMGFEKYFGDEVGLFNAQNRKSNPHAWTFGVNYTPVPALTFGIEQRRGQGQSETRAMVNLNIQMGVPFEKQFKPAAMHNMRSLESMRMALVERNNNIVMEYKKANAGVSMPAKIQGHGGKSVSFPVTMASGQFVTFAWEGTASQFANNYTGGGMASVALPAYVSGGVNTYDLIAVGTDRDGKQVRSNVMQVSVMADELALSGATLIPANDESLMTLTAQFNGEFAATTAGTAKVLEWTLPADVTTAGATTTPLDANGQAKLQIKSNKAGVYDIKVKVANTDIEETIRVEFKESAGVPQTPQVSGAAPVAGGLATVSTKVTDNNGLPVPNATVQWDVAAPASAPVAGGMARMARGMDVIPEAQYPMSGTSVTDANGVATFTFRPQTGGNYVVKAAFGDVVRTVNLFVADNQQQPGNEGNNIPEAPVAPTEPEVDAPVAPTEPEVDAPVAPTEPEVDAPVAPTEAEVDAPVAPAEPEVDAPVVPEAEVDAPVAPAEPEVDAPVAPEAEVDAPVAPAEPEVDAPVAPEAEVDAPVAPEAEVDAPVAPEAEVDAPVAPTEPEVDAPVAPEAEAEAEAGSVTP